jgi:hypothetical protein
MGSFIKHIVGNDERILLLVRLHWIYMFTGFVWMIFLVGLGAWLDHVLRIYAGPFISSVRLDVFGFSIDPETPMVSILFGGAGVFIFAVHLIKMLATEIALTNQRIIYKSGLIFVEVEEIDLVEIRAEHVHHGLFGRFLGYGQLQLDSRFVGDISFPAIRKPYKLVKAMHSARSKIHDPMGGDFSQIGKT